MMQAWWGHFLALSDGVTSKAIGKVRGVALAIMTALFTPENGECSFMAVFAAMANFCGGNFLAPQAGAFLTDYLGVTRDDYSQLKWAILIRASFRLLPLGALWLVPDGVPTDKNFLEQLKRMADPSDRSGSGWKIVAGGDVEASSGVAEASEKSSRSETKAPLCSPTRGEADAGEE